LKTTGIPSCVFIEDIGSYVTSTSTPIETLLKHAQTLYGKYKFMESQLVAQQKSLYVKIPDLESALQALKHLIAKQQSDDDEDKICECRFELADNLFAKAKVDTTKNYVLLWLGVSQKLHCCTTSHRFEIIFF
jgi:hypothetical protein